LIKAGTPLESLAPPAAGALYVVAEAINGPGQRSDELEEFVLNVLSVWTPINSVYAGSKAAAWSATIALRGELAPQGTGVTGVIVGLIDTAMSAAWDFPKVSPASVVAVSYDGVARGDFEVLADDESRQIKALLSGRSEDLNAFVTEWLAGAAS
jgi:short-subunit dehydrogenase